MNNDLMFSSESGMWDTPQELIDDLAEVFDWDLDVCASRPNVCANYYSLEEGRDAFENEWTGLWYCNPPYGRGLGEWVEYAIGQSLKHGSTGVMLVPSRTDTKAIQELMDKSSMIVFIRGRLVFGSDESWVSRYSFDLMDENKTYKQKRAIIKKIGGKLVSKDVVDYVLGDWDYLRTKSLSIKEWLDADYLKKDSAPFPSMFCVLGYGLSPGEQMKLYDYGTAVTILQSMLLIEQNRLI